MDLRIRSSPDIDSDKGRGTEGPGEISRKSGFQCRRATFGRRTDRSEGVEGQVSRQHQSRMV